MKAIENASWQAFWNEQSKQAYFKALSQQLEEEERHHEVLPKACLRFNAFERVDVENIRVIICGQDPYFQVVPEYAMGLSFSVPKGVEKLPSSLHNIRKELMRNYDDIALPPHGDLSKWSEQGIFMLNAVLTVRAGLANSHAKQFGWEHFTQNALSYVSEHNDGFVFLAWGKYAHQLTNYIDNDKHTVIRTSHPSGLGHYRAGKNFDAFTGSKCFRRVNEALKALGKPPIDWGKL